jgi:long-chain acyl-CoA synthetase
MKQSRFIEQIMVIGEGQKMPVAFIQLNFEFLREWAAIHKMDIGKTNIENVVHEKVLERIQRDIDSLNEKFGSWEKIKRFELTSDVWSIDGGQLTPTLKLQRKIIKELYKDQYQKICS